jgi:hypothetical protein
LLRVEKVMNGVSDEMSRERNESDRRERKGRNKKKGMREREERARDANG